jgi:hypothetical protein
VRTFCQVVLHPGPAMPVTEAVRTWVFVSMFVMRGFPLRTLMLRIPLLEALHETASSTLLGHGCVDAGAQLFARLVWFWLRGDSQSPSNYALS